MKPTFFLSALACLLLGCQTNPFCQEDRWFVGDTVTVRQEIDVLYFVSTNSLGEDGNRKSKLSETDRNNMSIEMRYVHQALGDEYRFFAPYYHQLTMPCFHLSADTIEQLMFPVYLETKQAFDYYMTHMNGGRPFVLMGFSQGAMVVLDLVKQMSDEQLALMQEAYLLGYRLTEEDLRHPHVVAATDATTAHTCVSVNTVSNSNGYWDIITANAATCINPLLWTTSGDTAQLVFAGDTTRLYADTLHHLLMAPDLPAEKYLNPVLREYVHVGSLHLGDLLFYLDAIKENIRDRRME